MKIIKMKNIAILLVLLLSVSQNSFAQGNFKFGLKAATNVGWIQPDSKTIERLGAGFGFAYGIMGDYYFQGNYALSTEIMISGINGSMSLEDQAFSSSPDTTVSNLEFSYKNQYVEIPLSLKFKTKDIGYISYWANFGFAPSFLTSAKATIKGINIPQSIKDLEPENFNVNDDEGDPFTLEEFDDQIFILRVPVIIGAGIEYNLSGNAALYAGLRFNNNFVDMFTKDKTIKATNNFVSLNLGIFF